VADAVIEQIVLFRLINLINAGRHFGLQSGAMVTFNKRRIRGRPIVNLLWGVRISQGIFTDTFINNLGSVHGTQRQMYSETHLIAPVMRAVGAAAQDVFMLPRIARAG
jgi:hypothetical protein